LSLRQAGLQDLWEGLMAADNTRGYLRDLAAVTTARGDRAEDNLGDIVREAALLHGLGAIEAGTASERALLSISGFDEGRQTQRELLVKLYAKLFEEEFGLKVSSAETITSDTEALVVTGLDALKLTKLEEGTHLFIPRQGNLVPIQVNVSPLVEAEDRGSARREENENDSQAIADDLGVIRIYEEDGVTLDLRSGLLTLRIPSPQELRAFVLAMLPLPEELT
jgi:hypothetical protein